MNDLIAELRRVPALANVPAEQLGWLAATATLHTLEPGERLTKRGDSIEAMSVVLEGWLSLRLEQNGQFRELDVIGAGGITGALPYSRLTTALAYVTAIEPTRLLSLDRRHFRELTAAHYELAEGLVHTMLDRVRELTRYQLQDEKLRALGKVAAGLAHELNNPAAAVVRSAAELRRHLGTVPEDFKRVMLLRVTPEQVDAVTAVLAARLEPGPAPRTSLVERSAREDELLDWLEDHGVEDADALTDSLIDYGFGPDDLTSISRGLTPESIAPVVEWVASVLTTEKLVAEIGDAAQRISGLVGSIKTFTHMDQAVASQPTDIRHGLETTLRIFRHKLEKKHVETRLELEALPAVSANPGELNQVWTNLIDNAIDAMGEGGKLEITGCHDEEVVRIEVIDDGPGVPPELQTRIFEPFFTTKTLGEGSGLGLDVVQHVVRQHGGEVKLDSRPGRTSFRVTLPITKS